MEGEGGRGTPSASASAASLLFATNRSSRGWAVAWMRRWRWWLSMGVGLALLYAWLDRSIAAGRSRRLRRERAAVEAATRRGNNQRHQHSKSEPPGVPSTRSSAEQAFLPPQATGGLLATLRNRKVSCSTKGVLLEFDPDTRKPRVIEGALPLLVQLACHADLYLITQCNDDQEERAVRHFLLKCRIFEAGLNPAKALFCDSMMGKVHMVRQLGSYMHLDGDEEVVQALHLHVPRLGLISSSSQSRAAYLEAVQWAPSLIDLFCA